MPETMRAVVYDKPFSVSVREVPKPTILHPDDVIVKGEQNIQSFSNQLSKSLVTTTCICGRYNSKLEADHPLFLPSD